MTWERQDGAGRHQRLGTRSKAVIREKRRGLGQGALGHLSYAPEAGEMGRQGAPLSQAPEQRQPNCFS